MTDWTIEQKDTLVALRDSGWDWHEIAPRVNHTPRSCAQMYNAIKRKQSHLAACRRQSGRPTTGLFEARSEAAVNFA